MQNVSNLDQPLPDWNNDMETRIQSGVDFLRRKKYVKVGDVIIIVTGWREGAGFTNCIRIIYVSPGYTESEILNYEPCT